MVSPRLARFARWFSTFLALLAFASALTGGFGLPPTEPLWRRLLFPTSLALMAASYWVAPTDAWLTLSPLRKRLFFGLLAGAILIAIVQLYWQTCERGACVAT
jgi:hypothetical protein